MQYLIEEEIEEETTTFEDEASPFHFMANRKCHNVMFLQEDLVTKRTTTTTKKVNRREESSVRFSVLITSLSRKIH